MTDVRDEIRYEFVTEAAVEGVVALYQAAGWWEDGRHSRETIAPMVRGSFCFLVARSEAGYLVGMGRVISDGASDAYIQDVVVLQPWRGRGIGRELVRRLTDRCLAAGLEWIGLVAEPGTRAFYEPLGYRAVPDYELMLHPTRQDGR